MVSLSASLMQLRSAYGRVHQHLLGEGLRDVFDPKT